MKTQTRILYNRLYYTKKIELHRKGKKSRTVRITPILICGIRCSPHLTGKCAKGLFLGGSWRRAGAHTRPAFPKMPTSPSAFPLLGARQVPGNEPTSQKGVKAWEEGSLRPKEISRYRDTFGQICAANNTASRSATRRLERFRPILICGICCSPHLTGKCGTRPFFRWVWAQGPSLCAPGISKNAYGLVGIPLIRGALVAGRLTPPPPKWVKAWGKAL